MTTRRRQLLDMITAENNRLGTISGRVKAEIKSHIVWLEKRLKAIDDDLSRVIRESPIWRDKDSLLQGVL